MISQSVACESGYYAGTYELSDNKTSICQAALNAKSKRAVSFNLHRKHELIFSSDLHGILEPTPTGWSFLGIHLC